MSHKKAKRIRKELFDRGINIQAEPYISKNPRISSEGRRLYQRLKHTGPTTEGEDIGGI